MVINYTVTGLYNAVTSQYGNNPASGGLSIRLAGDYDSSTTGLSVTGGSKVPSLTAQGFPATSSFVVEIGEADLTKADLMFFYNDPLFGFLTNTKQVESDPRISSLVSFRNDLFLDFNCNLVLFPIQYDIAWAGNNTGNSKQFLDDNPGGIADFITGDFTLTCETISGSASAWTYHIGDDALGYKEGVCITWFAVLLPAKSMFINQEVRFTVSMDFGGDVGVQTVSTSLFDPRLAWSGQVLSIFGWNQVFLVKYEDRESEGVALPRTTTVQVGYPLTDTRLPSLYKRDSTFMGWFVDGSMTLADSDYVPDRDITLVPRFGIPCSIAYSDPDGTGLVLPKDTQVFDGYQLTDAELPDLADPSYQFHGWYILGTDIKLEAGHTVDSDLSLQPRITRNLLVTYSGIDPSVTGLDDPSPFYVIPGKPIPADKTPKLSLIEYRFEGWSANGMPIMADGTYVPDGVTTLTARFVTRLGIPSEMTIRYNTQADAWVADSPVELSGREPTRFSALPLKLVPIARKGFSQIGWVLTFSGTFYLQGQGYTFVAKKELPLDVLVEQDLTLTSGCYTSTPETFYPDDIPVSRYIPDASLELMPLYRRDSVLVQPPVVFPALDYCDAETPLGVMLTSDTPGARIYYTLDGSDPADIEEENPAYHPDGSTPDELPLRIKDSAVSVPSGTRIAITCTGRDRVNLRAVAYLPWQVPSGESWGMYTPRETEFLLDMDGGSGGSQNLRHIAGLEPYMNIAPPYKHAHKFLGLFGAKEPPLLADDVRYWDELGHPVAGVPLLFGQTPTLFARWEASEDCNCFECRVKSIKAVVSSEVLDVKKRLDALVDDALATVSSARSELDDLKRVASEISQQIDQQIDLVKKNAFELVRVSNIVILNGLNDGPVRVVEVVGSDDTGSPMRDVYYCGNYMGVPFSLPVDMNLPTGTKFIVFAITTKLASFYEAEYDFETEILSLSLPSDYMHFSIYYDSDYLISRGALDLESGEVIVGGGTPDRAEVPDVTFNVTLEPAPPDKKIAVIKAVRGITGLELKEAKELVEGAPKPLKEGVSLEEAVLIRKEVEHYHGWVTITMV